MKDKLKVRLSVGQHTVNMPWVSSILTPSAKSRLINWLEFLQQIYLYLIIRLGSSVVEHWIEAPGVVGAIPTRGTQYETVTNS